MRWLQSRAVNLKCVEAKRLQDIVEEPTYCAQLEKVVLLVVVICDAVLEDGDEDLGWKPRHVHSARSRLPPAIPHQRLLAVTQLDRGYVARCLVDGPVRWGGSCNW